MRTRFLLILFSLIPNLVFGAATDYYIKHDAAGGGNGLTWATAWNLSEFETDVETLAEAGDRYFIMEGTYTFTSSINTGRDGSKNTPIEVIGVKAGTTAEPPTSADWAYDDDRPFFSEGAYYFQVDDFWIVRNIDGTTTSATAVIAMDYSNMVNCKGRNLSTFGRIGLRSHYGMAIDCEAQSFNGNAYVYYLQGGAMGCYFHDSVGGISMGAGYANVVAFNMIESCDTAIEIQYSTSGVLRVFNNTLYYGTTGIKDLADGYHRNLFYSNIISGFTTGANWNTASTYDIWDHDNWYDNDTDVTNVTKGANATALDPQFRNVQLLEGTVGTYTGDVFDAEEAVDLSKVVANQDFIWIKSGTGMTVGHTLITAVNDAADQVTTEIDCGENVAGDIVWSIVTGHDYRIGSGLKGQGFPGAFPGGLSTGYLDIGAVQRKEINTRGSGGVGF